MGSFAVALDEKSWVSRAREGDSAAFEAIYNRYERRIYAFIYQLMGNSEDAYDLTQDTFVKAYSALPRTSASEMNLSAWLHRIAWNSCMDVLRRRKLIRWLPWETFDTNPALEPTASDDPVGEYNQAETSGEVQVVLDRLGERVRLRVMDRGCGMDQATMARIFDPYFTTKDHGHGLGLAAVQGIIAGVSGTITCESHVGTGTTFTVLLTPCVSANARGGVSPLPELGEGVQYALVADDDELVREITVETLAGLGYTCLQVSGGQDCLRMLEQERRRIVLLVLDCRMPDLDGITVLKRLRQQGDHLPVVLISGMINVDSVSPLLRDRRTRFLAKPFSQNQLSATLDALFGSQVYRKRDQESSRTAFMVTDVIRQRNEENNRREAGSSQYRKKSGT